MESSGKKNIFRNNERSSNRFKDSRYVVCVILCMFVVIQLPQTIRTTTMIMSEKDNYDIHSSLELYAFSKRYTNYSKEDEKRLRILIAQYSAAGKYNAILNETSPINMAYAEKYGYDYLIYKGIYFKQRSIIFKAEKIKPSRATYNKIPVIEYAILNKYDRVLVLDADALIYDFSINIATAIPMDDDKLVAARGSRFYEVPELNSTTDYHGNKIVPTRIGPSFDDILYTTSSSYSSCNTWNINAGVTYWNLHHPTIKYVLWQWKLYSLIAIQVGYDEDQVPLHIVFFLMLYNRPILAVSDYIFGYQNGEYIRHFIRDQMTWSTNNTSTTNNRIKNIRKSVHHVCTYFNLTVSICDK